MKNKKIIIDIPFNICFKDHFPEKCKGIQDIFDANFQKTQTKEWINYRIKVFIKYTANSLINQVNQNFLCIMRYNEATKDLINDALSNYPKLPDNIIFVTNNEAEEIIEKAINEHNYLYHVRIDSDNMYESHFIELVDKFVYEEGIDCLLCHEGYMYDEITNRVAKFYHISPSFYVDIYNKETYRSYFRKRLFEEHMDVYHSRKHIGVVGYNYMIIVHESNLDNKFDPIVIWLGGEIVDEEEKNKILKEWNIK
jgi:hypothetical protein